MPHPDAPSIDRPAASVAPATASASVPAPASTTAFTAIAMPLSGEDQARADLYALLARLLLAAPDGALLAALAHADPICAEGGDPALERAWEQLSTASSVMEPDVVSDEFDTLFISIGSPPVNPYGSRYLSGFMNDTPLAELRGDLAKYGVQRVRGVGEFEDHLGSLCEVMRVLVAGAPAPFRLARQPVAHQQQFFEAHIAPWYARCVADIAAAQGANYYRLVAQLAKAFLDIEAEAFAVGAAVPD
ncbi:molecular chaperone [Massilia sp. H6]|uniref:TorD/DmsD family molecular chaperone n=1 Tax=Massilia sp. H6 TaxID=2970464 RepID=UPI002168ECD3|nr:molecular chaperone TorD family protein [Massilia sp. H6]UVW27400.1 molecular chaperone TorD family protein [Massilia sp. H6]